MGSDPTNPRFLFTGKLKIKYCKKLPVGKPLHRKSILSKELLIRTAGSISAMPSLQIIPRMLLASARTSALSPKEVLTLTNHHKQRIKEHQIMGEKATRARHDHDEAAAQFFSGQHMREWKFFPELRTELDQAYREAYRQESASYN